MGAAVSRSCSNAFAVEAWQRHCGSVLDVVAQRSRTVTVQVASLDGKTRTIAMDSRSTIADLKDELDDTGCSLFWMDVIIDISVCDDHATLDAYCRNVPASTPILSVTMVA